MADLIRDECIQNSLEGLRRIFKSLSDDEEKLTESLKQLVIKQGEEYKNDSELLANGLKNIIEYLSN